MRTTAALGTSAAALLLGACCLMSTPVLAAESGCANEARRVEQSSTYLPDCRAYELVMPAHLDGGEVHVHPPGSEAPEVHAALDGERVAWDSEYALPNVEGPPSVGLDYLSTRGSEGWRTEATVPPQSPESGLLCPFLNGIVGWSSNLTKGILSDGDAQGVGGLSEVFGDQGFGCGHDEPRLVAGEPEGFPNLFLRESGTRSYQLVNVTPSTAPHPTPNGSVQGYTYPTFLAGSADLSVVAFEDELPLTAESEHLMKLGEPEQMEFEAACKEEPKGRACWEGHDDLYVWSEGLAPSVRLVSILPDGEPVAGRLAGAARYNVAHYRNAVSADGARVFFEAEGNLYVRENAGRPQSALGAKEECTEPAMACTIQLDLPRGGAGSGGGGKWLGSNAEGTEVFFSDEAANGLTATTAEGSGANLYEYALPSQPDTPGTLVDMTPDAKAEVQGMSGLSEDGSYVYFVATGKLTGEDSLSGRRPEAGEPTEGEENLYVSHEGATVFIATLNGNDLCDWASNTFCGVGASANSPAVLTARVSGNGRYLAFNSVNELTGYANTDTVTKAADGEIFLYEAEAGNLACVSCQPSGAAPSAGGAAIEWAARTDSNSETGALYPQRNVSESGQVFFETAEALSPRQDLDGTSDVYEYQHGTLSLISSGTSSQPSHFLDASANGSDVFFSTVQSLLTSADSGASVIYDARSGGGLRAQNEPVTAPACTSLEGCHSPLGEAPGEFSVASAELHGSGNLAPPAPAPKTKPTTKALTKAQKLAAALRTCRKVRAKQKRSKCEKQAKQRYGAKRTRAKKSTHNKGSK